MKIEATRKYIRNLFDNVYCAGYADLQHIMVGYDATYYNSGIYGWNFDCYVDYRTDAAITTGYRNTIGVKIPREIIDKYENKAKEILNGTGWETIMERLEQNRREFFDALAEI